MRRSFPFRFACKEIRNAVEIRKTDLVALTFGIRKESPGAMTGRAGEVRASVSSVRKFYNWNN